MKRLDAILSILALSYVVLCLLQVLFFTRNFFGFVDNYLFVFAFVYAVKQMHKHKLARQILGAFIFLLCWAFLSQLIRGETNLLAHISYYFLFLKFAVLLLVSLFITKGLGSNNKLYTVIDGAFLTLVAVNLFLAINPNGWGELLQNVYTPSYYANFVYYHEPEAYRLAGTQLNPNDNAIIWACFILFYGQRIKEKWMFVVLALGLLLLTQSRTMVLIITLIGIYYVLRLYAKRIDVKRLLIVLPIAVSVVLIVVINSSYLRSLFTGEAFVSNSFLTRLENFTFLSDYSWSEWLIGRGKVTNPIETLGFSVDSEYLGLILQFGVIGLLGWLYLQFVLVKEGLRRNSLLLSIVFLVVLTSFTNFTFLHIQIGVLLSCFVGLSLAMPNPNK